MSELNYGVICKDEEQAFSVAVGLSEVNKIPVKVIAFEQEHEDNKKKEVNESEKSEEHDCEFQPICELLVLLDAIVGDDNE
jgi:hypothetical protein